MLDPRDWFGGHDDEDDDPVKKTLRYLGLEGAAGAVGQGVSDVGAGIGQAVSDVGSSIGSAVSPYLPQPSVSPAPEDYSFAPADNPLATGLAAAGRAGVEAYQETGSPLSPWSAPAFAPARAAYIAERALPEIGGEIGAAAGRAAAGPDAAPYFTVPESVPVVGGQDVGAEQVGRFIGGGLTDPLTYVGAAGAAAAGAPARRVAAELARGLPGVGEAELLGRGAVGAVRGLGSRVGEAVAGNAERVAAADARMAAEGSTLAPGTFGALPGGPNLEARIAAAEARLEHAGTRLEAADAMLAQAADAGSAAELRAARSGYSPARSAYDEAAARVEQLREQRRMVSRDIEGAGYGRPVEDAGIDTSAVEREATSAYGGQPEAVPPFRDDAPRSISMNAGFGVVPEAPSGGAAAARRLSELEAAGAPESTLQKWRALAEADVADPAGLAERLRSVEMVTPEDARAMLGERPEYLAPVAQFLLDQRRKVLGGGMTARDVGKAYYMTLMSMRSTAQEQGALQRKLASGFATGAGERVPPNPQLGDLDAMVNVHNGRPLGPIFTEPGPNGRRIVRPESAGAAWVWTDEGQRALNALDEGEFLPDAWEGGRRARLAFGSDTVGGNGALRPLTEAEVRAGKVNLTNLPAFVGELNEGIGALKAAGRESEVGAYLSEQAKRLMGIGTGKSPFIKQLLGFGDAVTIDAREINYWLSGRGLLRPGDTSPGANMARAASRWWGSERRVPETLQPRIQAAVDDLAARYPELTEGIDPADAGHILHHWIWDRSGGSSTAHTDVMASQRLAGTAGVVPDAVRPDRLAGLNRVLGQGIASSVSGGVGAQVNQEMNPDDPLAGIKGFAAGALVPPLAARGGMALARRAGRSADLGSAARIGLGDVPPSRIRRPALPGMEAPYVREQIPDVSDVPNRPAALGDVPPSAIRRPTLPGVEPPYAREQIPDVSDIPNRPPVLGDVPPSAIRRPTLPGMEAPYARERIPDVSEAPNRPPVLGDVPPSRIRTPELPGMEPPPPTPIGQLAEQFGVPPGVQRALTGAERRAAALTAAGKQPLGPKEWLGKAFGTATYSSLLGPATATVNIATGLAEPLWKLPRDIVGAAGRSVRRGDVQPFRELNQAHAGALYGLSQVGGEILDALRAGGRYASHPERPNLSSQTINPGLHVVASALEMPGRVAGAVPDALFGTVSRYQGQGEAAARIATDLGLTGPAWEQKVGQLRADAKAVTTSNQLPTSTEVQQVVDAGEKLAQRTTLTDPLGTIGQKAKGVAQLGGGPVGLWASPFFNSPWNALLRSAEKTPVGLGMNTQSSSYAKHYDAVVGSAVGLGMLGYAANGGVTGSGPEDRRQRELLQADGWQPYSTYVKLPGQETGHYIPNRAFGPFEATLNAVGEGHDMLAYQKDDADDRAQVLDGLRRTGKLIRQNPYLFSGLVSILDAAEGGVPAFAAESLARMTPFAATTRSLGMTGDLSERTAERGADVPLATEIGQRWEQSVGLRGGLPEAQDPFGRVRPNPRTGLGAFGPRITTEKKDAAADLFRGAGVGIGDPPSEIRVSKSPSTPAMPITPAERRAWDAARGAVLLEAAGELAADPDFSTAPKEAQQKTLRRIMDQAAKAGNGAVLETIDDAEVERRIEKALAKKAG